MPTPNDNIRMMDVTAKPETVRSASATATLRMQTSTLELIRQKKMPKGDVLTVSQTAGIMAAKQTPTLIPLCHPLLPGSITVDFDPTSSDDCVVFSSTVTGIGRTGFEMEALVAVSVAALNLYDMCKGVDKEMTIERVRLLRKSGGKSGTYVSGQAPEKPGRVVAVCLGQDLGHKTPVDHGLLKERVGLVGDIHAGTVREVSLLAVETINRFTAALESLNPARMRSQGLKVVPGDSAENLVTEGIDLVSLPVGTRLRLGGEAVIELTEIGKQFHKPGYFLLPLEGVFGSVVHSGTVKAGDEVVVC